MGKKLMVLLMSLFMLVALAACGGDDDTSGSDDTGSDNESSEDVPMYEAWKDMDPEEIEGDLTVITNRTDIVDDVFQDYKEQFESKYSNVNVTFEALNDYGGDIMPRINTQDFGDVQYLPTELPIQDIPNFFEPMGSLEEMQEKYLGVEERAVNDTVYGIPIAVTYTGVIYNKAVFEEAGITEIPQTQAEFLEALQMVKDNTDAIPLYSNYADAWPLTQWQGAVSTTAGTETYYNIDILDDPRPFEAGDPHYDHYKLMYDVAEQGLIEEDPLTTDWEASKVMMNEGKIATMVLGSWALGQIQGAGPNPDDIAIMAYPNDADRTLFSLSGDYNISISKFSENKPAAFAWVDWFINESGYSVEQAGGISAAKDVPLPDTLADAKAAGAEFVMLEPSPEELKGKLDAIDKESEVGLWAQDKKQILVEAAIGNRDMSFDDVMNDWNDAWEAAYNKIME
ncbi:ABC transporter substrate-binding protein [Halolactibacillus sp. JCM 19043]|uniref:ABC transporter substrate-binding protein n=1 Tax=Halolactibacillus sp. JCM 19043 TaxID=1460638 RepID=UPI000781DDF6|nr:ABC transporter substrate-binding protein [Halolactibacillus sp. JCM 19043]